MRRILTSPTDLEDHHWSLFGNCSDPTVDPEMMYPGDNNPKAIEAAKAVCQGCPVMDQCMAERARVGDRYGVWAYQTEADRQAASKRRYRAAQKQRAA